MDAETAAVAVNAISVDTTITISIILALCALFAPSITALINNRHNRKMRKMELEHDEKLHYTDIVYKNKYDTYNAFLLAANEYKIPQPSIHTCNQHFATLDKSLLLCDAKTLKLLVQFKEFSLNYNGGNQEAYIAQLTEITKSFNRELSLLSHNQ